MTMQRVALSESEVVLLTFEDFYRQSWPGAVRLAALLMRDARLAEELAQEAFSRMFPKWESIEMPSAYLRTSIVNACRNRHAHSRVERTKLPLLCSPSSNEFAFDALADAVAGLPHRQRVALVLRFYLDLPEAEIAQALGCRPGTVKSLTSRALAALRKGIEP